MAPGAASPRVPRPGGAGAGAHAWSRCAGVLHPSRIWCGSLGTAPPPPPWRPPRRCGASTTGTWRSRSGRTPQPHLSRPARSCTAGSRPRRRHLTSAPAAGAQARRIQGWQPLPLVPSRRERAPGLAALDRVIGSKLQSLSLHRSLSLPVPQHDGHDSSLCVPVPHPEGGQPAAGSPRAPAGPGAAEGQVRGPHALPGAPHWWFRGPALARLHGRGAPGA